MVEDNEKQANESRYNIYHQEYTIMAEYRMLQTEILPGIYVIPSHQSSFLWFGVIFVRSGIYEGGIFRFTITLPDNFPSNDAPVVKFTSSIYHPAIETTTQAVNLKEVFPRWDPKKNHIWQLIKYIHWIFQNLNFKAPANSQASTLYKSNRKEFMDKARECVATSMDHLYDDPQTDDKHYITFSEYDPEIHDPVKAAMLKPPSPNSSLTHGLSWVQPGSYQSFTKDEPH